MGDKHAEQTRAEAMASALQTVAAAARKIADGPSIKELQDMTAHIREVVSASYDCPSSTPGGACSAQAAPLMWDCGKPCTGSCIKAPLCCPRCGSTNRTMQNPAPPVTAQAKKKVSTDYYYAGNDILAGDVVYRATFSPLQVGDWTLVEQDGYLRAGMVAVVDPSRMEVAVDVHFDPKHDKPEMNGVAVRHWVSRLTALYRKVREGTYVEGMMVRGKLSGRLGFIRSTSKGGVLLVDYHREHNPKQESTRDEEFADPAMIISGWGDKCPSRTYTRRLKYGAKPIGVGDRVVTLSTKRGEWLAGLAGEVDAVFENSCRIKITSEDHGGLMGAAMQKVARVIPKTASQVCLGDQVVLLCSHSGDLAGSVAFVADIRTAADGAAEFSVRIGSDIQSFYARHYAFSVVEG